MVLKTEVDFHPHIYCMLFKAGINNPDHYMKANMKMLTQHFDVPWASEELNDLHEAIGRLMGKFYNARSPYWRRLKDILIEYEARRRRSTVHDPSICMWPTTVLRNGDGHDPRCPAHTPLGGRRG